MLRSKRSASSLASKRCWPWPRFSTTRSAACGKHVHVRTLVEVALVRLCKLDDLDALPDLVAELRDGTDTVRIAEQCKRAAASPAAAPSARTEPRPEPPAPSPAVKKKRPNVSEPSTDCRAAPTARRSRLDDRIRPRRLEANPC